VNGALFDPTHEMSAIWKVNNAKRQDELDMGARVGIIGIMGD